MSIKGPDDIKEMSSTELVSLHKELSFQLRIVNDALKGHNREIKFRRFFKEYPYYIENGEAIKIEVNEVIDIEQAGFGYDRYGLPTWGKSYGMGEEEFACLKDPSELAGRLKLEVIRDNMVELSNNNKENITQKQERIGKILEGFGVNV